MSVSVEISDTYSEVDTVYYLWSKVEIDERDYLLVKNNGKLYGQSINSGEISEDGTYYLYMLAYDSLNNYREVPPKVKISNEESLHYLWRIIHCLELKKKKRFFSPMPGICFSGPGKALVTQLCPTLCNPMDCSLPDSSVHGIL